MNVRYVLSVLLLPLAVSATTLTQVPMQGGMVMPMISYHADLGHLHVMMPPEIPQLTPLLVSHPGDQFDPAHPWFSDLDPSASGLSFSRRYGFVMDDETDPLPPNTVIWLRKLSGPPELEFFRYATSPAPGAWDPIFGTDGSPAARMWNGMMFHPGVTAPPGTNGYTAIFEAYLVDTNTMTEVDQSGTGPMTLRFTNVPDGRPALGMDLAFVIAWDSAASNYVLESAASVASATWTATTHVPVEIDGQNTVIMGAGEAAGKVFRLRTP
jgi:hypothetical protein